MAVDIGTQLNSYEVTALLGKGGMGEVYRALDTKLKRDVAIKILPEEFARDADRVSRFQREAEVLASLNHPNIAAIYDLQEAKGSRYLVMELVEGMTLAERIALGPIPPEEALRFATNLCEALEAAHEKGIIHRDLKPANVKIAPDGKLKVLDFGLAKALEGSTAAASISNSPTLIANTFAATNAGVILGTAAYMSPEQARGIAVDHRTDIWAFGCVLYEMLTGRQAFQGELVSDVLASILAREADYTLLQPQLHPRLKEAIRRCLEKDRKRRWQAIGDVRIEIQHVMTNPHGSDVPSVNAMARPPLWRRALPIVITAIAVAAGTYAITANFHSPAPALVARFPVVIEGRRFNVGSARHVLAMSPQGTDIVYVADSQLYLRKMGEMEPRRIQGTENTNTPFFSPDGQWLAFYSQAQNQIKKVAISGGASVTVSQAPQPSGASWSRTDEMFIGAGSEGILRISATNGKAETVIRVDAGEEAQSPQLLPDGENVLFTLAPKGAVAERWNKAQIVVQSLKTGRRQVLVVGGADARYVRSGHIVYGDGQGPGVLAVPFDIKSMRVTSGPVPVLESVARSTLGGAVQMSFAENGSLVYAPGFTSTSGGRILALTDRFGQMKAFPITPAEYFHPRISPNGKQLVVEIDDGKDAAIWIYDLDGATAMRRLTFGSADRFPLWSPDGQSIVFQSDREKDLGLFRQRADGSGTAERLTRAEEKVEHVPQCWSPDGKTLIFSVANGSDGSLWSVSVDRGSQPILLIDRTVPNQIAASLSPDGRWIAYTAIDGVQRNVYVQPVPPTGAKYQVTADGGISPIWSPDGKQLIYSQNPGSGIGNLASVDVQMRAGFVFGKPLPLPIKGFWHNGRAGRPRGFDMTPDGKQFIVMVSADDATSNVRSTQQLNVVLNWLEELKQRVPAK
jgi:serine/threonine-protein kinase